MLQSERLFDSNWTNTDFETVKSNSILKELHQKVTKKTHLVDLEADGRVTRSSNRVNGEFSWWILESHREDGVDSRVSVFDLHVKISQGRTEGDIFLGKKKSKSSMIYRSIALQGLLN